MPCSRLPVLPFLTNISYNCTGGWKRTSLPFAPAPHLRAVNGSLFPKTKVATCSLIQHWGGSPLLVFTVFYLWIRPQHLQMGRLVPRDLSSLQQWGHLAMQVLYSPPVTPGWSTDWPLWTTLAHSDLRHCLPSLLSPGQGTGSHHLLGLGIWIHKPRPFSSVLHPWPSTTWLLLALSPAHSEFYALANGEDRSFPEHSVPWLPWSALDLFLSSAKRRDASSPRSDITSTSRPSLMLRSG